MAEKINTPELSNESSILEWIESWESQIHGLEEQNDERVFNELGVRKYLAAVQQSIRKAKVCLDEIKINKKQRAEASERADKLYEQHCLAKMERYFERFQRMSNTFVDEKWESLITQVQRVAQDIEANPEIKISSVEERQKVLETSTETGATKVKNTKNSIYRQILSQVRSLGKKPSKNEVSLAR